MVGLQCVCAGAILSEKADQMSENNLPIDTEVVPLECGCADG